MPIVLDVSLLAWYSPTVQQRVIHDMSNELRSSLVEKRGEAQHEADFTSLSPLT